MRKTRTQAEIVRQCEARMKEIEAKAAEIKAQDELGHCKNCRFAKGMYCHHPLVKGLDDEAPQHFDSWPYGGKAGLCGLEKALYRPSAWYSLLLGRKRAWVVAPLGGAGITAFIGGIVGGSPVSAFIGSFTLLTAVAWGTKP